MCAVLGIATDQCDAVVKATSASEHGRCWIAKCSENMCSSVLGKLGDSLVMIRETPGVANMIVDGLATGPVTPTLNALAQSDFAVRGVQGVDPPPLASVVPWCTTPSERT